MKTLVEKLYKNKIPHNEGYTFVCNEDIYIPIYQVYLNITKRISVPLNVVEEKALELINVGVHNINEIADILGIERNLLEITIADLYTKDMIYTTSDNCKLLTNGRDALKTLDRSERKPDFLKDVYIDSITGEIMDNVEQYKLLDVVNYDDLKLKPAYIIDDVEYFCKRFNDINIIFRKEMSIYQDIRKENLNRSMGKEVEITDELISIDSIDKLYVKFYKVPICIYISNTGNDIDIIPKNKSSLGFREEHKTILIEQIRNQKIMRKIFNKYSLNAVYSQISLIENVNIEKRLRDYYLKKNKEDEDLRVIEDLIFNSRKLADGEIDDMLYYLIKNSNNIKIYIDKLEDFAWNTNFITILTSISIKTNYYLYYNRFNDERKAINQIKKTVKSLNKNYFKEEHSYYIKYIFDDITEIVAVPYNINVFESDIKVKKLDYFLLSNN
jgi:hypothetical protein